MEQIKQVNIAGVAISSEPVGVPGLKEIDTQATKLRVDNYVKNLDPNNPKYEGRE
jgi:hypothetical protein